MTLTSLDPVFDKAALPPGHGGTDLPPVPRNAPPPQDEVRRSLSVILTEIVTDTTCDRVSVGDLVQVLHLRAFGAMLLIFALPNALPALPGTSAILGLPLLYLTFQLMMGRTPWLPRFMSGRSISRADLSVLVTRIQPMLQRAERLLSPRWLALSTVTGDRCFGALCLVLAIVLVLPIPLGNMLPAFAISVIALGILEKDGVWIAVGSVIGLGSLAIVGGVVFALLKAGIFIIAHSFA
ncbi:MAG: exopolysaccharide biosynthesis protein [Gemmobacter sp.]|nr:exopolysaccharide biosynthesis protein [Gemmobacter sp.]